MDGTTPEAQALAEIVGLFPDWTESQGTETYWEQVGVQHVDQINEILARYGIEPPA